MIPISDKVQNQTGDKTAHPSSNSSVNATGTRLRRRLSKIFHCDSPESGFLSRLAPGPAVALGPPAFAYVFSSATIWRAISRARGNSARGIEIAPTTGWPPPP